MKDYTFTSDLIADDIRCKIKNINKEGQETFITVWNIKGDRRVQVLQELQELTQIAEDDADIDILNKKYDMLFSWKGEIADSIASSAHDIPSKLLERIPRSLRNKKYMPRKSCKRENGRIARKIGNRLRCY